MMSLAQLPYPGAEDRGEERLPPNRQESPATPLEREESARAVRAAMARLAGRQRAALELQFQDHSYAEIAAELRMTPKAAKSLLYRARLQLRATLHAPLAGEAS